MSSLVDGQKRWERWVDRVSRVFAYTGIVLLAVAAMRGLHAEALRRHPHPSPSTTGWLVTGGALALVVFLVLWGVVWWEGRHRRKVVGEGHIADRRVSGIGPVDAVSTTLLVTATLRFLSRVNHVVEVGDGYYDHVVETEWVLPLSRDAQSPLDEPASAGGTRLMYLLPVMRLARNRLVDNFVVRDATGARISPCNTQEFCGVVRAIVEDWAGAVLGVDATEAVDELVAAAQFEPTDMNSTSDTTSEGSEPELVALLKAKTSPPSGWPEGEGDYWPALRDNLIAFCTAVMEAHIIFVPIVGVPGERVVLEHAFTRQPTFTTTRLVRDRLRYFLGLRPYRHELTITGHAHAASYHLQFRAAADQYVHECNVEGLYPPGLAVAPPATNVVVAPLDGTGARDAHIYVRPAENPRRIARARLLLRLDCREKPPGLLGIVALVAVAQLLLIWIVGKFYAEYFPGPTGKGPATDVPALLLALPGVAAAWLGAQFTSERLRATSIATVMGVFVCGALAIGSTVGAVSRSGGSLIGSHIGLEHPYWVLLMLLSALLSADLLARSAARGYRYARRVNNGGTTARVLV